MADKPSDVVLAHYGVKGMKWGKRKAARREAAEARKSSDFKEVRDLRKKPASELSNKELKRLNERMNLEKNYKKLLEEQPKELTRGQKAIQAAKVTGKTIKEVNTFANSPMGKAVISVVGQALRQAASSGSSTPGVEIIRR